MMSIPSELHIPRGTTVCLSSEEHFPLGRWGTKQITLYCEQYAVATYLDKNSESTYICVSSKLTPKIHIA